jgi:hypothetical protein
MIPVEPHIDSPMGVTRMNDRKNTPEEPHLGPPWLEDGEQPLLVRPVAHLRSPLFDEPAPLRPPSGPGQRIPVLDVLRAIRPYLVPIVAIGLPFLAIAGGDWLWVVIGVTVAAIVMHELVQRVTFSFGEGFLAFRNRDEWPHGVQEEYDVRYSWPSTASIPSGSVSSGR